ncbi:MAG: hypothetical protein KUL86_10280 [Castellaniella sp.]|nr:hypothetical protein [Castellaniella sp.]
MMALNILAGVDTWLGTWSGDGGDLTKPDIGRDRAIGRNLKKPEIGAVPATGKTAANDPAQDTDCMAFHDRVESTQVKVRTEVRTETAVTTAAVTKPVTAASAQAIEWRPLADAYYRHHFGCLRCIAAGQNPHLSRCTVGAPLWQAYQPRHQSHDFSQKDQS